MTTLKNYNLSIENAEFTDINPRLSTSKRPILLGDLDSIKWCSLPNLFLCIPGTRGPIFQPEFGIGLWSYLQEPQTDSVVTRMTDAIFSGIRRWEPRIDINSRASFVVPLANEHGYQIRLVMVDRISKQVATADFEVVPK